MHTHLSRLHYCQWVVISSYTLTSIFQYMLIPHIYCSHRNPLLSLAISWSILAVVIRHLHVYDTNRAINTSVYSHANNTIRHANVCNRNDRHPFTSVYSIASFHQIIRRIFECSRTFFSKSGFRGLWNAQQFGRCLGSTIASHLWKPHNHINTLQYVYAFALFFAESGFRELWNAQQFDRCLGRTIASHLWNLTTISILCNMYMLSHFFSLNHDLESYEMLSNLTGVSAVQLRATCETSQPYQYF